MRLCDVPQWYDVIAQCGKCQRRGWVDRWELQRTRGKETLFIKLEPCLLCLTCGNKADNFFRLLKAKR